PMGGRRHTVVPWMLLVLSLLPQLLPSLGFECLETVCLLELQPGPDLDSPPQIHDATLVRGWQIPDRDVAISWTAEGHSGVSRGDRLAIRAKGNGCDRMRVRHRRRQQLTGACIPEPRLTGSHQKKVRTTGEERLTVRTERHGDNLGAIDHGLAHR